MSVFDASAILHIGEAGLEYLDEYDGVCMINFEACGRNANTVLGGSARPNCVGRWLITVDVDGSILRSLELFTTRPTIFVMESAQQFRRIRFQVEQMGWKIV